MLGACRAGEVHPRAPGGGCAHTPSPGDRLGGGTGYVERESRGSAPGHGAHPAPDLAPNLYQVRLLWARGGSPAIRLLWARGGSPAPSAGPLPVRELVGTVSLSERSRNESLADHGRGFCLPLVSLASLHRGRVRQFPHNPLKNLARPRGFEPPTPGLGIPALFRLLY